MSLFIYFLLLLLLLFIIVVVGGGVIIILCVCVCRPGQRTTSGVILRFVIHLLETGSFIDFQLFN